MNEDEKQVPLHTFEQYHQRCDQFRGARAKLRSAEDAINREERAYLEAQVTAFIKEGQARGNEFMRMLKERLDV